LFDRLKTYTKYSLIILAMVVDIALQQQLPEIFSTNHNHHRSSSSSSSTYKRNSTTINTTSSSNTMTNGHRFMVINYLKTKQKFKIEYFDFFIKPDELGKKAEQILGHAPAVVDYCRQPSIDFSNQHPPRINIM
jgi:hypothetical protein